MAENQIDFLKFYQFVLEEFRVELDQKAYEFHKEDEKKILNWIIPEMGESSGGHLNIFRFISGLEERGFHSKIYLYHAEHFQSDEEIRRFLHRHYPELSLEVEIFLDFKTMGFAHGTVVTSWQTAYGLRYFENTISKFYFVQDFEPYFYAQGSEYELAKNTYRFGYRGITAGEWLKDKLGEEFSMKCDSFHFSYDKELYQPRKKLDETKRIFFYARPVTPRRDFELGLAAIQELKRRIPDLEVLFAGWDVSDVVIPFPYKNLGILTTDKLSETYSGCDLCFVISHTNLSLLPVEIMASGSVAVCSKGANSSWLVNENNAVLVDYSVEDIVEKMEYYLNAPEALERIRESGLKFALETSWDREFDKVKQALQKGMEEDAK